MLDFEETKWARDVLKKLDFFAQCSDEEILALMENLERHHFKAGSTIMFFGEISNRFYLIYKGSIGIWKSKDGNKQMVAELGPEKYFGEISLMTPSGATATVKAQSDAQVFSLAYENLEEIYKNKPEELQRIQAKIEERKQEQSANQPRPE